SSGYAYVISQPSWRSTPGRPAASRSIANVEPAWPPPRIQADSPDTGSGTPNARVVRSSNDGASSLRPSASRSVTVASIRSSVASVWPSGVASAMLSVAGACCQSKLPASASLPWCADSRPATRNGESAIGFSPVSTRARPAQPATKSTVTHASAATPIRGTRLTACTRRTGRPSRREALDRFQEDRVVRCRLELRAPHVARASLLALRPQHFAQVSGDLGIGAAGERALQEGDRVVEAAHPEQRPAHAVEDERVVWRDLERALDQRVALVEALRAVDERVAERVERLRVVGLQLDEALQLRLGLVDLVELLGDHRIVVQELRRIGMLGERLRQHRVGARVVVRVAQDLRLGLPHLDALVDRHRRQVVEVFARAGEVALLRHHHADPELRDPVALALGYRLVARDRLVVVLLLFRDLSEVELDDAVFAVVRGLELVEHALGAWPVLHLERQRADRERVLALVGIVVREPLEDRAPRPGACPRRRAARAR